MRPILLLSALALLCSAAVFVQTGIPAAQQNGAARDELANRMVELERAVDDPTAWVSDAALGRQRERLVRAENASRQLAQQLLAPKQSFAAFLVSHEGPLPGFNGGREDQYLELANQTLALAARGGIQTGQPFLEVRSGEEFRALGEPEQEALLQRAFLVYRLIDQLSRFRVKDIRLLDIAAVADNAYAPTATPHKVTVMFACPVEDGFAAIAGFFTLAPPPLCDLVSIAVDRLEPADLGLSAIDFAAPPVLFRWEMSWLSNASP
ncbi:MAG: hypothetical protein U1E76_08620 [Planctomycetota bacterium]